MNKTKNKCPLCVTQVHPSRRSTLLNCTGVTSNNEPHQKVVTEDHKIHDFKTKKCLLPKRCDHCRHMLWKPLKKELKCRTCGLRLHKKCNEYLTNTCQDGIYESTKQTTEARIISTETVSRQNASSIEEKYDEEQIQEKLRQKAIYNEEFNKKWEATDLNIVRLIGKGSFGQVFLVEKKSNFYAMKAIEKALVFKCYNKPEDVILERDILIIANDCPFLAHLYCTYQSINHLFLVMDFINGGDLNSHIEKNSHFNEDSVRFYGIEIASGIQFLHKRKIIHRDLKLDNILLDSEGHCRIIDFGLSKKLLKPDEKAKEFVGTIEYIAPEVLLGKGYSFGVDWWAFGVILYKLLTKDNPFQAGKEDELYENILRGPPFYPSWISSETVECVNSFFVLNPAKRLGIAYSPLGKIQNQPFFSKLNWKKVVNKELEPPYKPVLKSTKDTSYFDEIFTKKMPLLKSSESKLPDKLRSDSFDSFSFVNTNFKQH